MQRCAFRLNMFGQNCGCCAECGGVLAKLAQADVGQDFIAGGVRFKAGECGRDEVVFKLAHWAADDDGFWVEDIGQIAHHNP